MPVTRRILLMDDESLVLKMTEELLQCIGYDVTVSENGEEAEKRYRDCYYAKEPFDAVILDLTIRGGMDGTETFRRIREINPEAKAILATGFSSNLNADELRDAGFSDILIKPFDMGQLKAALEKILVK